MRDECIQVRGQMLRLLPERAVYWEDEEALLVTDLHVGKAAAFRSASIPVPAGTTRWDIDRLERAVARTGPSTLYVLGDLYHAAIGMVPGTLTVWFDWIASHSDIDVHVVLGNHDRRAGRPPSADRITYHEDPVCAGPFWLSHYPEPTKSLYTLAGHLHPGIVLHPQGGDRIRVPCFHFSSCVGVLPAFGAFTGLLPVEPVPEDRVYAVADDEVIRVQ